MISDDFSSRVRRVAEPGEKSAGLCSALVSGRWPRLLPPGSFVEQHVGVPVHRLVMHEVVNVVVPA
jgi:hypothetical protein